MPDDAAGAIAGSLDAAHAARERPGGGRHAPGPDRPEPGLSTPPPLDGWFAALLRETCTPAEVPECIPLPSDGQYAVALRIPRQASREVLLPRRPLERARVDPVARTWVRNLLRASMEALRRRHPAGEACLTSYFAALKVRSLPGPRCARCEGPLLAEDPIVVHEASRWHLACPPAW